MDPLQLSEIGSTGINVTRLGLGGAAVAGIYSGVSADQAVNTIQRGLELGLRYFDTAPLYGHGKSETYFAEALGGVARDSFVLSTKVGRVLNPLDSPPTDPYYMDLPPFEPVFDYSRDGILRSLEESLQRLQLDRVDIAYIHDPDDHYEQAISEAYPTLADLRAQGVVKTIGAGMNQWEMLHRFGIEGDFDCFLLAGRYTLLDQSALAEFLPLCNGKGISVVLGGPYNSGVLASDLSPGAKFDYEDASPDLIEMARAIRDVCERHGVPLKAAALQFGLAHPAVVATIPGARSVGEVEENFEMASFPIPADLWVELRDYGLISDEAPTPTADD